MGLLDPPALTKAVADVTYVQPSMVLLHDRVPTADNFRQIPVVMWHEFASVAAAQGPIKDFKAWGYEGIFFSELLEYLETGDASNLPPKPIVYTDDDGGASSYTNLYAALQAEGQKCTYFLVPDWIDGTITQPANGGQFLEASSITWAQANEMQASGLIEFQSHTKAHGSMRMLSGPGQFTGNGEGAGADFLYCKQRIEQMIPGSNIIASAAPYGVINDIAIESLRDAGCRGQRITMTGRGMDGNYDGSGPGSYTYASTDPLRIPITSTGSFKDIKRENMWGVADRDGNMFQNGKMRVTSRGITLPSGWTFTTNTTLPNGASPATGPVLRGFGTGAATGAYHTDLIPFPKFGSMSFNWYVQATGVTGSGARMVLDCYKNFDDASPLKTLTDAPGASANTSWKQMRWTVLNDGTYDWVRPRFEIVAAGASSEMLVWNITARSVRSAF